MTAIERLPQPASRHALGLLRFPDRRTHWVVVMVATMPAPVTDLAERLATLHDHVPMVGARLGGETWRPGAPPRPVSVEGEPLGSSVLDRRFDLGAEAPLRVVVGGDGRRLALAGHHAAFDGLALVALLDALTGGAPPVPVTSPPPGPPGGKGPLVRRLLRPADAVAASAVAPGRDTYVSRAVVISGARTTGRIAAACVAAIGEHNRRQGAPWRRVGVSVSVGGPAGVGNVASYRRIDLPAGAPVEPAVVAALAAMEEPAEQVKAPKAMALLAPLVDRFSDTLLVSNLGRHVVAGVERIDFFPVARGRSAVAFASATVAGKTSTLTLRARDLDASDAEALLSDAARRFAASSTGEGVS